MEVRYAQYMKYLYHALFCFTPHIGKVGALRGYYLMRS